MNLKELSRITNFSVSTISKAFSNADDISDDAKKVIFEAAKKYGCFGKYYRGKYHKKIIVIICPEVDSDMYASLIEILKEKIENDNGMVLISIDDFDTEKQLELIDYYASYLKVDGIIVIGLKVEPKKGYETPIVGLGSQNNISYLDSVNSVTIPAYRQAVEHLISLGHTKIAYAGERYTLQYAEVIREVLSEHGIELIAGMVSDERFEKAGLDIAKQIIKMEEMPTAVICAYDSVAIGFIKGLQEAGYSVPEDMSVIGRDNARVSEYMFNKLSTIAMKHEEVCDIIWRLMKKKIENPYYTLKQKIEVCGELIVRDTTAPPRTEQ